MQSLMLKNEKKFQLILFYIKLKVVFNWKQKKFNYVMENSLLKFGCRQQMCKRKIENARMLTKIICCYLMKNCIQIFLL